MDQARRAENRLGLAVQLATLPWLGFVPDDLRATPAAAVARLADQLGVPAGALERYGAREQTRTEHLRRVAAYLGWRACGAAELKALDDFLLLCAMEHDAPSVLFHLAGEHLRAERIIRPGVVTLIERVGAAREAAWAETHQRLAVAGLLTAQRCEDLDDLLAVKVRLDRTRLAWLGEGATQATPKAIKVELAKLAFLRGLDADTLELGMLAPERRRWLAGIGRRSTNQALQRRHPQRRYSVLVATITEAAVEILDELLVSRVRGSLWKW